MLESMIKADIMDYKHDGMKYNYRRMEAGIIKKSDIYNRSSLLTHTPVVQKSI